MSQKQWAALEKLWSCYGLNVNAKIDFTTVFRQTGPLILEIGFGKGESLLQQAQSYPHQNYLGIEVYRTGIAALLNNLNYNPLDNIKIFLGDAIEILPQCIPEQSLDVVQIFFPDPWPKLRHHKRRLIQLKFIHLLHQKIKPEGILHLVTDWEDYAKHILTIIGNTPDWNDNVSGHLFASQIANRPQTKFERRGLNLGHKIWDLYFVKRRLVELPSYINK